jgi:hypothetical protein
MAKGDQDYWRKLEIDGRRRIRVAAKENPKAFHNRRLRKVPDARTRFALYKDGQSVNDYVDKAVAHGVPRKLAWADVRWDFAHGFIRLDDAEKSSSIAVIDLDRRAEPEEQYFGDTTNEELKAALIAKALDLQNVAAELIELGRRIPTTGKA